MVRSQSPGLELTPSGLGSHSLLVTLKRPSQLSPSFHHVNQPSPNCPIHPIH